MSVARNRWCGCMMTKRSNHSREQKDSVRERREKRPWWHGWEGQSSVVASRLLRPKKLLRLDAPRGRSFAPGEKHRMRFRWLNRNDWKRLLGNISLPQEVLRCFCCCSRSSRILSETRPNVLFVRICVKPLYCHNYYTNVCTVADVGLSYFLTIDNTCQSICHGLRRGCRQLT